MINKPQSPRSETILEWKCGRKQNYLYREIKVVYMKFFSFRSQYGGHGIHFSGSNQPAQLSF
jgi:hypothetical protein